MCDLGQKLNRQKLEAKSKIATTCNINLFVPYIAYLIDVFYSNLISFIKGKTWFQIPWVNFNAIYTCNDWRGRSLNIWHFDRNPNDFAKIENICKIICAAFFNQMDQWRKKSFKMCDIAPALYLDCITHCKTTLTLQTFDLN